MEYFVWKLSVIWPSEKYISPTDSFPHMCPRWHMACLLYFCNTLLTTLYTIYAMDLTCRNVQRLLSPRDGFPYQCPRWHRGLSARHLFLGQRMHWGGCGRWGGWVINLKYFFWHQPRPWHYAPKIPPSSSHMDINTPLLLTPLQPPSWHEANWSADPVRWRRQPVRLNPLPFL